MMESYALDQQDGSSSGSPLTREELLELERAPQTGFQVLLDYMICLFPFVLGGLALAEYFVIPNLKGNESTEIYAIFIGLLMAALGGALPAFRRHGAAGSLDPHHDQRSRGTMTSRKKPAASTL